MNEASTELIDHVFFYWQKHHYTFAQVSKVSKDDWKSPDPKVMARIIVRLDQKSLIYGRVAETIINGLEAIGGFNESLMHIGILLVFFFQERLFKTSFLRQLYIVKSGIDPKSKNIDEVKLIKEAENN